MSDNFTWQKTNAPTVSSRTDDIWFLDHEVGWAVNSNGKILHTKDGFDTFVEQADLNVYLRCIAFASEQVGWVGTFNADQVLFGTKDGGQTWSNITSSLPSGAPPKVCGLSVVDENVVYASGTNNPQDRSAIVRTLDGGTTWDVLDMQAHADLLVDIFFVSAEKGWVVGGRNAIDGLDRAPKREETRPVVLYTEDGGATWVNQVESLWSLDFPIGEWGWKIQFLDDLVGFVSLENYWDGAILKTTDGGSSWSRIRINDRQRNANLEGIGFLNENQGWVGGWGTPDFRGGFTSKTEDGGKTWDNANDVGFRLNRFRFVEGPNIQAYASGDTVYRFTNASPTESSPSEDRLFLEDGVIESKASALELNLSIPEGTDRFSLECWDRYGMYTSLLSEESPPTGTRRLKLDFASDDLGVGPHILRLRVDKKVESAIVRHTGAVSFETDIKPLFRNSDRQIMLFFCDLHKFDDVSQNAERIFERLVDGSMPCDAPWSNDKLELFEEWIAGGKRP